MHTITGQTLFARDGEEIGEITDVLGAEGPDMQPRWLTVKTGWFAQRLVPFDAVSERGEQYVTTCSAEIVKSAPKVKTHIDPAGRELDALRSHYGIRLRISA